MNNSVISKKKGKTAKKNKVRKNVKNSKNDIITINDFTKHPFITLGLLCLIANIFFTVNAAHGTFTQGKSIFHLLMFGIIIFLFLALCLKLNNKLNTRAVILLLFAFSFYLHIMYILYTPYTTRQHDVGTIGSRGWHMEYIEYFLINKFKFPNFNPFSTQFYHPPLHHFIAALWLKLNILFGVQYNQAVENIQFLTLFYSGCCTILSYKIFKEFKLKNLALIIPFAIVCFHPTFIILSGSINNDVLCITLMLATILNAIRWYKDPNFKRIILLALCLGLSMMTKLSGGLTAPAVAYLFLIILLKKKEMWKNLIGQFAVFAVICIPLGLWWPVRNHIEFGLPVNYVLDLGKGFYEYLGNMSVWQRLFDFSSNQLANIFANLNPVIEHNVWIFILKSSIFGEWALFSKGSYIVFAKLLFMINALVIGISIVSMIVAIIKKSIVTDKHLKIFIFGTYLTIFGLYLKFCFDYPEICTEDFRYIVPTFIIGSLFIGFLLKFLQSSDIKYKGVYINIITISTAAFCIGSTIVYTLLAIA